MHAVTDLDQTNLVVWPKWCYANGLKDDKSHDFVLNNIMNMSHMNNNNRLLSEEKEISHGAMSKKSRRKTTSNGTSKGAATLASVNGLSGNLKGPTKAERVSPEPNVETAANPHISPSPSGSPKSPVSHRTRTPSFSGTPPHPAFTPPNANLHSPYDRFSPAALGSVGVLPGGPGAVKHMENLVARNCSDLMRSLAAKYNNSHPNDYFSSHRTDFLRSSVPSLGGFKGMAYPPLGEASPLISSTTNSPYHDKKSESTVASTPTTLSQGIPQRSGPPIFPGAGIPGFPTFPLVDVSSTQVLLNMVRNASVPGPPQLENYLRGAVKRPADAPTSPLDLSSSMGTKRPRTELGRSFDVKSLFPEGEKKGEERMVASPPTTPTGGKMPSTPSPGTLLPLGKAPNSIPCVEKECPSLEGVLHWSVEDVCDFVRGIDLCAEYAEAFREHRIDGSSLLLLTEDHLTTSIQMKLGPALKLRSVLARKLGSCGVCLHCAQCHSPSTGGERHPSSAPSSR